jgi:opacity protein-like surface antigen
MRYNLPNNWFAVVGGGGTGLNLNGIGQGGAFDSFQSLHYDSVQFGYNFKNTSGLPLTVYAGVDTLKVDSGIGGPLAPFGTTSSTLTGYSAHTGVEFEPLPNVSLSLGLGYTQQPGR